MSLDSEFQKRVEAAVAYLREEPQKRYRTGITDRELVGGILRAAGMPELVEEHLRARRIRSGKPKRTGHRH